MAYAKESFNNDQLLEDVSSLIFYPESPPMAEVDESPLHNSMNRNKESLRVKLMLRRPINQLVAQGIIPELKTSPNIHEQRQKLERAKMGDLLKAKIQQRPDREELVRQHILEVDVGHLDPSLAERQRMLKKCKLVDSLNDQLSHRPGPLELIKKNILHTEEPIERAVKEGQIEFRATSEGQKIKPEPPDHYMTIDDDSSQYSDTPSPSENASQTDSELSLPITTHVPINDAIAHSGTDLLTTAAVQAGIVTVLVSTTNDVPLVPISTLPIVEPSFVSQVDANKFSHSHQLPSKAISTFAIQQPAPGKDRKIKKSKTKNPRTRMIKFHEYKGPQGVQKKGSTIKPNKLELPVPNSETSYELLLQQQQLFLQWELEVNQKCREMSLQLNHSASKVQDKSGNSPSPILLSPPPPPPLPPPPPPPLPTVNHSMLSAIEPFRNLEGMTVNDLKAELKKRNLRVSGAKPHLIERLKNSLSDFTSSSQTSSYNIPVKDECHYGTGIQSPLSYSVDKMEISSKPNSPMISENSVIQDSTIINHLTSSDKIIIREQQRKIEELQQQLLNSQLLLQQQHRQQEKEQLHQQLKQSVAFQKSANVDIKGSLLQQQKNVTAPERSRNLQKPVPNQNSNLIRNINNNIVILKNGRQDENNSSPESRKNISTKSATNQNHRQRTSPNSVIPQVLISSDGTKQLIINSESYILPENVKIINDTLMSSNSTPQILSATSIKANDVLDILNSHNLMSHSECVKPEKNIVTLHILPKNSSLHAKLDVDDEIRRHSDLLVPNGETGKPAEIRLDQQPIFKVEHLPHDFLCGDGSKRNSRLVSKEAEEVENQSNHNFHATNNSTRIADDQCIPSNHLSEEELGIDMGSFPMVLSHEESELEEPHFESMDVDNFLERLISSKLDSNNKSVDTIGDDMNILNDDPTVMSLLRMDESDFKSVSMLSWD